MQQYTSQLDRHYFIDSKDKSRTDRTYVVMTQVDIVDKAICRRANTIFMVGPGLGSFITIFKFRMPKGIHVLLLMSHDRNVNEFVCRGTRTRQRLFVFCLCFDKARSESLMRAQKSCHPQITRRHY